ncbi:hypothetical protein [Pseudovibrio ascidiaceicola]|uniref:hypothetical protein n=1 Tax=Pseudovibrio ascidiaceicola TaxID=285279 RepID=UPI000D68E8BA|nr:hypothetical protein [Pseudovibrio ascidiaceicola]
MQTIKYGYPDSNEQLDTGIDYYEKAFEFSFQDHESLKQYLRFCKENGTGSDPLPCCFKKGNVSLYIEFFARLAPHPEYGFESGTTVLSLTKREKGTGLADDLSDALIIATGNHLSIGLVIRGKCIGKVFALEDINPLIFDNDMVDIPSDIEGITKLGDSFEEFINALSADEDDIEEWEEDFGE